MSKITIEQLKESFQKNIITLYDRFFTQILVGGGADESFAQRVSTAQEQYVHEVADYGEELGVDIETIVEDWYREALNSLRIGDIIFDGVLGREEP